MTPIEGSPSERNVGWLPAALAAAVLLVSALALDFALRPRWRHITPPETGGVLRTFWQRFFDGPEPPLVVYSNKALVGPPLDQYTGVGEVMAIHELDNLFSALHRTMRLKRGRLLTSDDVKGGNLVFVGLPSENPSVPDQPGTDFVFKISDAGPREGELSIINTHPGAGEEPVYFSSAATDYAVVGFIPAPDASRTIMILAGLTTLGTQAAVEFVCRPREVEKLLGALDASPRGAVPPFEALLRVKVSDGVPVESELVAAHRKNK